MNIKRGTPPPTVDRELAVDLTRDEVLAVLVKYVRDKIGPNIRLEDLSVHGDEHGNLQNVTLAGVEIVPIIWNGNSQAQPSSTSATPVSTPVEKEKVSNPAGLQPIQPPK